MLAHRAQGSSSIPDKTSYCNPQNTCHLGFFTINYTCSINYIRMQTTEICKWAMTNQQTIWICKWATWPTSDHKMVGYINNINKHCKKDNISTDMKMIRALDPKLMKWHTTSVHVCWIWERLFMTWTSNYNPQNTVKSNYLSMSDIICFWHMFELGSIHTKMSYFIGNWHYWK